MDTKKLRQKILDLAIRGKLVPQDPNDEPASVLLERIRAEKERLIAEGKIKRSKKSATSDTSHYENVPFEVPEGWCWTTLQEISLLIEDCPHTTAPDEGSGYALVRTPNIGEGYLILDGVHRVCEETYNKRNVRAVPQANDIVYAREAPAGNAAVIKEDEKICLGQRTVLIRPAKKYVDSYLLAYFILSPYSRNRLISKATGSTVQHVNMESIRPHLLPLPPYKEQLRIADRIKNLIAIVDELSESEVTIQQIILQIKSKILDLAIHGKLVPQDANDEPASELLKRINPKAVASCDNPHYEQIPFDVPYNWVWVSIDEINKFKSKSVNPQNYPTDQFELYSVPTFETGEPEFPFGKDVASSKVEVAEGDVLLCKINPHLNRVWVVRRRMAQLNSLASSEWIVIRTDEIMPEYLALTMQSPYFRELMMSNVSGVGGSLMRAQPTFVKQYMLPIPPIGEQKRIIEKVAQFNLSINTIASTLL